MSWYQKCIRGIFGAFLFVAWSLAFLWSAGVGFAQGLNGAFLLVSVSAVVGFLVGSMIYD